MKTEGLFKKWGVAITGGIASGKSFVSQFLKQKDYLVYDADTLSREVCEPGRPCYEKIVKFFGKNILAENKEVDRGKLAQVIFSSEEKRKALEAIVHPEIQEELLKKLKKEGLFENPKLWFYEAALIFEKEKEKDFLETWLVYCSPETQFVRLKKRDIEKGEELVKKILASQQNFLEKKKRASFLINTDHTKKRVLEEVEAHLASLLLKIK